MFHGAALIALAASVLTPSGVAAGIQADPVCLSAVAQPGHSYPLSVYVSGSAPLSLEIIPAHGTLERRPHQVPASWVRFGSNPAGTGTVALTLAIPDGAAPGAYWSDVNAAVVLQPQPGSGALAQVGAAADTAIVFTVGPSATPPPPCGALDLAQSTGKFPAWPTAAFATTGWKQVFAEEQRDNPKPITSPTAGTGAPAAAPSMSPAANQAPSGSPKIPANWPGWLVIAAVLLILLAGAVRLLRGGR